MVLYNPLSVFRYFLGNTNTIIAGAKTHVKCVCVCEWGGGGEVSVKLMCNNNICLFNERVFHLLLFS